MKAVILKPVMWNSDSYTGPSGVPSFGGFSKDFGYGHEEWNNNPNWLWRGFKVFHTEAKDRLAEYSSNGELGIIMTASHGGKQFAVGVATNVYDNSKEDRELIADELNVFENWKEIWKLPIVKTKFNNDETKFMVHWKKNYQWIKWKCPTEHYYWFKKPVVIDPLKISGKTKIISRHGTFQGIEPDKAVSIIASHLPSKNHPCLLWLENGTFDPSILPKEIQAKLPKKPRKVSKSTSSAPTNSSYQYWVEGDRSVEPLHARLQAKFVRYLKGFDISFKENVNCIDVVYEQDGNSTFCEIKPTDKVLTKYAIRMAVGQLLEYRYKNNHMATLEIVLGNEPSPEEKSFLKAIGMHLSYWDEADKTFKTHKA